MEENSKGFIYYFNLYYFVLGCVQIQQGYVHEITWMAASQLEKENWLILVIAYLLHGKPGL